MWHDSPGTGPRDAEVKTRGGRPSRLSSEPTGLLAMLFSAAARLHISKDLFRKKFCSCTGMRKISSVLVDCRARLL